MDHISANRSLPVTERENISGCRVFDGEDQGKCSLLLFGSGHRISAASKLRTRRQLVVSLSIESETYSLCFIRSWKPVQNVTVTAKRLV